MKQKPKVGTYLHPNMEQILSLKPDLVVIEKNPIHLGDKFSALKLATFEIETGNLAAIRASLEKLGQAVGAQARAAKLNADIQSRMDAVASKIKGQPRRRIAFLVGRCRISWPALLLLAVGRIWEN